MSPAAERGFDRIGALLIVAIRGGVRGQGCGSLIRDAITHDEECCKLKPVKCADNWKILVYLFVL